MAVEYTDEQIARMAKARVAFKMHFLVYLAVNVFLALVWFVTTDARSLGESNDYWPIWTHLGWGLGLAIHGFTTYGPGNNMLAREEEKIRRELGKS